MCGLVLPAPCGDLLSAGSSLPSIRIASTAYHLAREWSDLTLVDIFRLSTNTGNWQGPNWET